MVFNPKIGGGAPIDAISQYEGEHEWLMKSGAKFEVLEVTREEFHYGTYKVWKMRQL